MGKTVDSILISLISAGSVGDRKWCVKKNSDHVKIMNGRQGDAPATWRMSVTPLAFCLYPPLASPGGGIPDRPPSEVSRGSRHSGASAMSRPLHFSIHSITCLLPVHGEFTNMVTFILTSFASALWLPYISHR